MANMNVFTVMQSFILGCYQLLMNYIIIEYAIIYERG